MVVRVTFRSEIYLEGDTISEIKDKFENLPFYAIKDINGKDVYDYGFCEIVSVEDGDTYDDLMNQWNHAYDKEKDYLNSPEGKLMNAIYGSNNESKS